MTKWEYAHIEAPGIQVLIAELNQLGQQGWELTSFTLATAPTGAQIFAAIVKRPKP